MLPLWKLNPVDGGEIDLKDDLPRDEYHNYREANPKPVFIYAAYFLSDSEKKYLADVSGHKEEFAEVIISKDFDNNLFYNFPSKQNYDSTIIDKAKELLNECKATIKSAENSKNKNETERYEKAIVVVDLALKVFDSTNKIDFLLNAACTKLVEFDETVKSSIVCAAIANVIEQFNVMIEDIQRLNLSKNSKVTEYIIKNMPKYVYYSNYGNLDSRIYLPKVLYNIGRKDLGAKESAKARTLKTLFEFVKLDPEEITDLGIETSTNLFQEEIEEIDDNKKEREILLSSASSSFTKSFNEWWKQGDYIFEFQADENFFRIWVSDSVRPERIELEARSTGLQWFFSFYLVFLLKVSKTIKMQFFYWMNQELHCIH